MLDADVRTAEPDWTLAVPLAAGVDPEFAPPDGAEVGDAPPAGAPVAAIWRPNGVAVSVFVTVAVPSSPSSAATQTSTPSLMEHSPPTAKVPSGAATEYVKDA
jgi:hypothetical protein